MKYLAIDYGAKRIGLAMCDPDEIIVSPYAVVENDSRVPDRILEIVHKQQIQALVIGLPLNMDGTEGPQAALVKDFAAELTDRTDVPVHLQDERLTSFGAYHKLTPAELTRKRKKQRLDAVAAAEILKMFLEGKNSH